MTPDFDPARLALVPGRVVSWSLPSSFAATGVHQGYRQATVVQAGHLLIPDLEWLIAPFAPVWSSWLSWIDPAGFVVRHIDAGPYRERWQLPITAAGRFMGTAPTPGVPFRVHHHEWHEVTNPDDAPRVSLVVDRDVLLDVPTAPFQLEAPCPAPCSAPSPTS